MSSTDHDEHLTVGALRELEKKLAELAADDDAAATVTDREVEIVRRMVNHYRTNRYAIWVLKHLKGSSRKSAWVGKATALMQLRDPQFVTALASAGFHVGRYRDADHAAQALHDMLHRVFRSKKGIRDILQQRGLFLPKQTCLFAEAYEAWLQLLMAGYPPSTELMRDVWMASFLNAWTRRFQNAALPAFIEAQARAGPLTLQVGATCPMTQELFARAVTFPQGASLQSIHRQLVQAWAQCINSNVRDTVKQLRDKSLEALTLDLLDVRHDAASYVPSVELVVAGHGLVAHTHILSLKMPGSGGAILPSAIVPLLHSGMRRQSHRLSFSSCLLLLLHLLPLSLLSWPYASFIVPLVCYNYVFYSFQRPCLISTVVQPPRSTTMSLKS